VAVLRVSWEPWSPQSGSRDEDFAAGLLAEFVVGGEVDGVEEESARGLPLPCDGAGPRRW